MRAKLNLRDFQQVAERNDYNFALGLMHDHIVEREGDVITVDLQSLHQRVPEAKLDKLAAIKGLDFIE